MDLLRRPTTTIVYIKQEPDCIQEEIDIQDHVPDDPYPNITIQDIVVSMLEKTTDKNVVALGRYKCDNCERSYKHKFHWNRHKVMCGRPPPLQCDHCSYRSREKYTLAKHLDRRHSNVRRSTLRRNRQFFQKPVDGPPLAFKCPNCVKSYEYKYALDRHLAIECSSPGNGTLGVNIKTQPAPNEVYPELSALNLFSTKVKQELPSPCSEPEEGDVRKLALDHSMPDFLASTVVEFKQENIKLPARLECAICAKQFMARHNYLRHVTSAKCVRATAVQCCHCDYSAVSKSELLVHMRRRHEECFAKRLRAQCPKCPRNYKNAKSLSYHLKYECGVDPKYQCSACPYAAKQRHRIRSHIHSKHMNVKSYWPIRHASRVPFVIQALDETRFTCRICMRSYKEKDALSRHERDDCGKNSQYPCSSCPRVYRQMRALARHVEFECNKLPQFACTHCNYRAKRKYTLTQHVVRKHATNS